MIDDVQTWLRSLSDLERWALAFGIIFLMYVAIWLVDKVPWHQPPQDAPQPEPEAKVGTEPTTHEFGAQAAGWGVHRTIQEAWDELATEYADLFPEQCSGDRTQEPKIPEGQTHHKAADLWLSLDDCVADDHPGVNFIFGGLHAIRETAWNLGVRLDMHFPDSKQENDDG